MCCMLRWFFECYFFFFVFGFLRTSISVHIKLKIELCRVFAGLAACGTGLLEPQNFEFFFTPKILKISSYSFGTHLLK